MLFKLVKVATQTGLGLLAAQQTLQHDLPWAILEAKLNELCLASAGAPEIVQSLEGQSIQFQMTPPNIQVCLKFINGQLVFKPGLNSTADAQVKISSLENIAQWIQGDHQLKYTLDGNFETLLSFQQLIRSFDLELGDCLLPYLGPQLTTIILQGVYGLTNQLGELSSKVKAMGESFISNEQTLFVRPKAFQTLQTQLREKSFDIERLEARLKLLEAKIH